MTEPIANPAPPFLDLQMLMDASEPAPRTHWLWYAIGMFLLLWISTDVVAARSPELGGVFRGLSAIALLLLLISLPAVTLVSVRQLRAEQQQLEAISELVQLRRWPEAAIYLQQALSRPARSADLRAQALLFLATVLARYHRFDDAITLQDYLVENERVDPSTAYGLRVGRAMALLHQDRLFDADRAIVELRRVPNSGESAGLALVEIYRDVKTGHPLEAIDIFQQKLPRLREQLGHRLADAWALVARAYDLLGRESEARSAVANATVLAPAMELLRRYPELEKLTERYQPAPAPAV